MTQSILVSFRQANSSKHKHTHDDQALSIITIASVGVPAALFVLTFLPHCALCLQGDQRRLVLPLLGRLMLPLLVLGRPTPGPPRRHNQGGLPLSPLFALDPFSLSSLVKCRLPY
jgi:hypothetical protein